MVMLLVVKISKEKWRLIKIKANGQKGIISGKFVPREEEGLGTNHVANVSCSGTTHAPIFLQN